MNPGLQFEKKGATISDPRMFKKIPAPQLQVVSIYSKVVQPSFPLPPSATVHLSISTGPSCREWHIGPRHPRQRCLEGHRGKTQRVFRRGETWKDDFFSVVFLFADFSHDISDHRCSFHSLSDETRKEENTQGWKQKDSHVSWNKFTVTKKTFKKKKLFSPYQTLSNLWDRSFKGFLAFAAFVVLCYCFLFDLL